MGQYDQMISDAAERYKLDPGLLTKVISTESGGNPNAVSPAGARGLMQLMPGTASDLGVTDPHDPAQNIDGGARYLRQQLDRFGNPRQALAAYNFGPENVAAGKPLPEETRNYVDKILGPEDGGTRPDVMRVLQDPNFKGLPEPEQIRVLSQLDPNFAALPGQEQSKVVQQNAAKGVAYVPAKQTDPANTEESDNYTRLFIRGLIRGPVDTAEGMTVLAEKALQMVGFIDEIDPRNLSQLVTGEDPKKASWADSVIRSIETNTGIDLPEAKTKGGRVVQRTGEEIGATMATLYPITMAARAAGVLRMVSPARLALLEGILATGGGVTAGAFRELFSATPDLADFVGEFVGSMGTTAALGVVRWAKNLVTGQRADLAEKARQVKVGKDLLQSTATGDDLAIQNVDQGIQKAEELQQVMPDFKPTTGGVARKEPGLGTQEQSFSQTGGGRTVGKNTDYGAAAVSGRFTKRGEENLAEVKKYVESQAPPGDLTDVGPHLDAQQKTAGRQREAETAATVAKAEAQRDAKRADVTAQTERIVYNADQQMRHAETRALDRAHALGQQQLTEPQRGAILRSEYEKELTASTDRVNALYGRLDQTIKMPMAHTLDAAAKLQKKIGEAEDPVHIPSGILAAIKKLSAPPEVAPGPTILGPNGQPVARLPEVRTPEVTFKDLDDLQKRIGEEMRSTEPWNGLKKKRLMELKQAVEQDLDALAPERLADGSMTADNTLAARYPLQSQQYREARSVARKEIMRLKSGTSDRLRYKDFTGRYDLENEDLPDRFLKGQASVDDLIAALGNRPAAMEVMREQLRVNFLDKTMDLKTDRVDPLKAKRWLLDRNNQAVLSQFPELRPQFEDAAEQSRMAKDARAEYEAIQRDPEAAARLANPDLFDRMDTLDKRAARTKALMEKSRKQKEIDVASGWLGEDADKVALSLISNPKTRRTKIADMLARVQDNPEALAGFQRALWDASLSKWTSRAGVDAADNPALMANKMRMFLLENEDWMGQVFGPDRMEALGKAKDALGMIERAKYTNSKTALMAFSSVPVLGPMLARFAWSPSGFAGMLTKGTYYKIQQHLAEANNEQIAALFEEAFFDPKVARTFMLMAHEDTNSRLIRRRLHAHLLNMNQLAPGQYADEDTK